MAQERIGEIFDGLIGRYPPLAACRGEAERAAALMIDVFRAGGKLLTCGNGGSAADAQHIVGELMKSFVRPRPLPRETREKLGDDRLARGLQGALPAVSLAGEAALATAFINDCEPELLFAQQVLGLGREGDALLAISTSGNAQNVVYALKTARALSMKTIALTGEDGGQAARLADVALRVPARETYRAQEYHLPVYHALCLAVEEALFPAAEAD